MKNVIFQGFVPGVANAQTFRDGYRGRNKNAKRILMPAPKL